MKFPNILNVGRTPTRPINVAVCFDDKLVLPLVVFVAALARSMRTVARPVRLFAFHFDPLKADARAMLVEQAGSIELKFVAVPPSAFELPIKRQMSKATFVRLQICDLLPDVDKVLYLDVDTLVLKPIDHLYDTDLGTYPIAACRDYALSLYACQLGFRLAIATVVTRENGQEILPYIRETIGLRPGFERDYFNAGVMLLDLEQWRHARIGDQAAQWAVAHPTSIFHDQDALNAVIGGAYRKLDHRWNSFSVTCDLDYLQREGVEDLTIASDWRDDPWIVHYAGRHKPWSPPAYATKHDALFWMFASETPVLPRLSERAHPEALARGLALVRAST